jgi:uncharacterized repeat protein (TIGR01451 family)
MTPVLPRPHATGARSARLLSAVLFLFLVLPVSASTRTDVTRTIPKALPLIFELNAGQTSSEVKFLSRGAGYTLFLTPAEVVLGFVTSPSQKKAAVLRMQLPGANLQPRIAGVEELPGKVNYFIGDDPARWRTNVPTYAKVRYESIYPGVDLIYYGNQRQFEYDFVVAPGADPRVITLAFEGPENLALDPQGDLVFQIGDGELRLQKPLVYQEVAGSRKIVAANYILKSQNRVGVEVAAYDRTRPLVIDPVLVYSTYLGGSGADIARAIAADPTTPGVVYVAGETTSTNFPTTAGVQPTFGKGTDCFVASFNTNLSGPASRIFSTYLGGSGADQCYGIAVDKGPLPQNVYVVGRTTSTNFPFATKLNGNNRGGSDAIVVKLKADGSALLYSVYLGGSADEWGLGIAVDGLGQAYVTGRTTSTNFPVVGGFQSTLGDATGDAFITKINAAGNAFLYSSYLGGNGTDQGNGIAVDPSGIAYVTGTTASSTFPTKNGFQLTGGGSGDAFVARVNTTTSGSASLLYSTYLGGGGADSGFGIATDGVSAYVTGQTASDLSFLSPPRSFGTPPSGSVNVNAFAARIDITNPGGQATVAFLAYLGAGSGNAIAVDTIGDAYVTGQTGGFPQGSEFPTSNAFQKTYGGNGDAFVARLNTDVTGPPALVYGSYLGGTGADQGLGIALDAAGDGYVTGSTSSTDFKTTLGGFQPGPSQTVSGGTPDAFVVRISDLAKTADLSIAKTGPSLVGAGAQFTYTLSVKNAGPNAASNVTVSDTLPTGVTLVSAIGNGWTNCSGTTTVTCTLASLAAPPAGSPTPVTAADLTITVTAPAEGGQTLSNKASVSSDTPLLHPENSSSNEVQTTVTPRADLSITKTVSAPGVNAGAQFTYTLSVKNAGPSTASAVTVRDTLPGGVTLVGASGTGWICTGATTVTCTRPGSGGSPASLPVGSAPDIVLSVTASSAGGTIFNQASVSSETSDPNPSNNSATAQTVVNERVNEGAPLTFQVSATDANGNPLTYSASNLPQGATFDPLTRTFTWTPNSAQGGPNPYLVYFTGSNGQSGTTTAVAITVVDTIGDRDGDGVPDGSDNCPDVYNPDQVDVCHNSPEIVNATSALSQTTSTGGALNLTFTASFNGGTNGTYFVPVNPFNTICRVTDDAGQPVRVGGVAEGPPITLSLSALLFVPPGATLDSKTTFDLKPFYPNLVRGTVACDYVNFAHIPKPEPDDPTIWKGIASAPPQTVIVGLYTFSGFASPADHQPFNLGRTVPVKFSLRNSAGAFVSTAVAQLFVQKLDSQGNKVGDLIPATSTNSPDNKFRYDFTNNQYVYNMSTDTLTVGQWQLVLKLDNGTTETIVIVITT